MAALPAHKGDAAQVSITRDPANIWLFGRYENSLTTLRTATQLSVLNELLANLLALEMREMHGRAATARNSSSGLYI